MKLLIWNLFLLCSVFFTYHVEGQIHRQDFTMAKRVQQLTDMANKKLILKFDSNKFRDYVKMTPRNYSVIIMFTAMSPQRQCVMCQYVYEQFTTVVNSYRYFQAYSNKLFFAMVDFDEAWDVFQMMHLNTVPIFIHFSPEGKLNNQDLMDIEKIGFTAEAIAKWIGERTGTEIRVFHPPNYLGIGASVVLFALVGGFVYLGRNNLNFIYNKNVWAFSAMFFCMAMVSGQMWNHIRGPPFVRKNRNGELAYIHGSSQSQFIFESYIIINLNAAVSMGMILLIEAAKNKTSKKKNIFIILALILISVSFSLILSIFRAKLSGYPYSIRYTDFIPNLLEIGTLIIYFALVTEISHSEENNLNFIYNSNVWAVLAIFFCTAMVSGQMWNHIRGPPLVRENQNGEITYIHESLQNQVILETCIIINLNAAVTMGVILLIETAKTKNSEKKNIFIVIILILISVSFSMILHIFRVKLPVYPYRFLV